LTLDLTIILLVFNSLSVYCRPFFPEQRSSNL
jgi:hypothetical protein